MSTLRTCRSRKRSKKNNGSQSRAASTSPEPETEPDDLLPAYAKSSSGRPPKGTLGPQPTLEKNIQPTQAISDDARKRAETVSLIGARCALTHVAATKGDNIHDQSKVQLMHVVQRASEELLIRSLEYILGKDPDSICVDSSSNLMFGIHALHEPFDAPTDSWGLLPARSLLWKVAAFYTEVAETGYDAGSISAFWDRADICEAGRHQYSVFPFGNFNHPITRELLDAENEPTGQQVTFTAPYASLLVDSHLSLPYVLWNFIQKLDTQQPSVLCTQGQLGLLAAVQEIATAWKSLQPPVSFYNPPVPLLDQPAFIPGSESDEEKTVHSLRTRKVTTQGEGDDIDKPAEGSRKSTGARSATNPTAGQKRKSRYAGSTASNANPTTSSQPPEPRPRKSRPGRSAPSRSGKD